MEGLASDGKIAPRQQAGSMSGPAGGFCQNDNHAGEGDAGQESHPTDGARSAKP